MSNAPQAGRYRITAAAQRPKPTPNAPQAGRYRITAAAQRPNAYVYAGQAADVAANSGAAPKAYTHAPQGNRAIG